MVQELATIVTTVIAVGGVVGGAIIWFKRWVRQQVSAPMVGLQQQIGPLSSSKEGHTTRALVEDITKKIDRIESALSAFRSEMTRAQLEHLQKWHSRNPDGDET